MAGYSAVVNAVRNVCWSFFKLSLHHTNGLRICVFSEWSEGLRRLLAFNEESTLANIGLGAFHTVLVSGAGFVYSYGLNDRMQLGCPEAGAGMPLPRQPLRGLGQPIKVLELFCGVDHSVLLTEQGCVFAWGANK